MRANVDILEKYIENLVIKKNLLQSSVEAYKLDINEYLSFQRIKKKIYLIQMRTCSVSILKKQKINIVWLVLKENIVQLETFINFF